MIINRATLEDCQGYPGTVVVIDVIRAFTTAAVAFSRGAKDIHLVGEVSDALKLREKLAGSRIMGEVGGAMPPGFDYGNSPSDLSEVNLAGVNMIQRTTAGTQGVVRSTRAESLIAGTFVNAKATARYLQESNLREVTFVITGNHSGADGAEDYAYADYMEALLNGSDPDPQPYKETVMSSTWGKCIGHPDRPEFPAADAEHILSFNKYDFVMLVQSKSGRLIMTKEQQELR